MLTILRIGLCGALLIAVMYVDGYGQSFRMLREYNDPHIMQSREDAKEASRLAILAATATIKAAAAKVEAEATAVANLRAHTYTRSAHEEQKALRAVTTAAAAAKAAAAVAHAHNQAAILAGVSAKQCPAGTHAYHSGSHCCKRAVDTAGAPITYRSGSCGSGSEAEYIVCPYGGEEDGACHPSARQLTHAAAAGAAREAQQEVLEAADLARVRAFPRCPGKCVISFGLYGADPKYTQGMIRNAELAPKYFPGWVVRVYTDGSSPQAVYGRIRALGGEIVVIEGVGGGIAGMFWRFLVADDAAVDRFIVRDSDSRLNLRERFAVQEWIESGKAIHSIRDHPNHERPLNGGMWGGVKGVIPDMAGKVKGYGNRRTYGGDLDFLGGLIWPLVKHDQISHDAYSCAKFPNSRPFPTRRSDKMEHVGQVYFADETTRDIDITCPTCPLNIKAPMACRAKPEWENG